jgi:putative oxidoreductase
LPPIVHVAGYLELIGGILVALGLVTGIVAFINSGTMAVAYWTAHAPHGWHPIANQGELAAVYCFVFLFIAAHGAGIWSIDSVIRGRSATVATTS